MKLLGFFVLLVLLVFSFAFEHESEFEQNEKYNGLVKGVEMEDAMTDVNSGILEKIKQFALKILKKIMEVIEQFRGSEIFGKIALFFGKIFMWIVNAVARLRNDFWPWIKNIAEEITTAVRHFFDSKVGIKIKYLVAKMIENIKAVVKYLHIDRLDDIAAAIVQGLEKYDPIIVALVRVTEINVVEGVVNNIADDIRTRVAEMTSVIDRIHEFIQAIRRGVTPTIPLSYTSTFIEWIKDTKEILPASPAAVCEENSVQCIGWIIKSICKAISDAIDRFIKKILTIIPDTILRILTSIIGEIHQVVHGILREFMPKLDAVLEEIWGKVTQEAERMHQEILNIVYKHSFTFLSWLIEMKNEMAPLMNDGRDLAVNFLRDLMKIIKNDVESLIRDKQVADNGRIADLWKKILAVLKRSGKFLVNFDGLLESFKPVLVSLSDKLIKLITYNMTSDIVKVINGGHVPTIHFTYKSVVKTMVVWSKVKSAFRNLNEKNKVESLLLWMKLRPIADKVMKKHKQQIIQALQHDGTIVINDGTKIVISVIDDVVKVSINDIDGVSGKLDVRQVQ